LRSDELTLIRDVAVDTRRESTAKIEVDGLEFTNPFGYKMSLDLSSITSHQEVARRIAVFDQHLNDGVAPAS